MGRLMNPKFEPAPPMTLGNMRERGVHSTRPKGSRPDSADGNTVACYRFSIAVWKPLVEIWLRSFSLIAVMTPEVMRAA
jgi:hypothetical protein